MRGTYLTRVARWILREDKFELMVSPAIADLQFERSTGSTIMVARAYSGVAKSLFGAVLLDVRTDAAILRDEGPYLLRIVAIQVCYYAVMLTLIGGAAFSRLSEGYLLVLGTVIVSLSVTQTLISFWPRRFSDLTASSD